MINNCNNFITWSKTNASTVRYKSTNFIILQLTHSQLFSIGLQKDFNIVHFLGNWELWLNWFFVRYGLKCIFLWNFLIIINNFQAREEKQRISMILEMINLHEQKIDLFEDTFSDNDTFEDIYYNRNVSHVSFILFSWFLCDLACRYFLKHYITVIYL